MRRRTWIALGLLATLVLAAGCYEPMRDTQGGWERAAPDWVVKKPGEVSAARAAGQPAAASAAPVPQEAQFKPVTEIVHPILEAKGNWTIRVWFFYGNPETRTSGVSYANDMAKKLEAKGYQPYVTDLLSSAIVSVGAWDDPHDPELKRVWREMYDGWLEAHRGRKSTFQRTMEQWYDRNTVFGDQPRPISVIDLQMKMKGAYGIPLTEEEKKRYGEYLENQKKKMYGYDRFGN